MKEFRIVFKSGGVTEWEDASEWTIEDMIQWKDFNDYYIEYR